MSGGWLHASRDMTLPLEDQKLVVKQASQSPTKSYKFSVTFLYTAIPNILNLFLWICQRPENCQPKSLQDLDSVFYDGPGLVVVHVCNGGEQMLRHMPARTAGSQIYFQLMVTFF